MSSSRFCICSSRSSCSRSLQPPLLVGLLPRGFDDRRPAPRRAGAAAPAGVSSCAVSNLRVSARSSTSRFSASRRASSCSSTWFWRSRISTETSSAARAAAATASSSRAATIAASRSASFSASCRSCSATSFSRSPSNSERSRSSTSWLIASVRGISVLQFGQVIESDIGFKLRSAVAEEAVAARAARPRVARIYDVVHGSHRSRSVGRHRTRAGAQAASRRRYRPERRPTLSTRSIRVIWVRKVASGSRPETR